MPAPSGPQEKQVHIMSAVETFRPATRPVGIFARINAAVQNWLDVRDTRNALHRLTDRELTDIGLTRGDIEYVARNA